MPVTTHRKAWRAVEHEPAEECGLCEIAADYEARHARLPVEVLTELTRPERDTLLAAAREVGGVA